MYVSCSYVGYVARIFGECKSFCEAGNLAAEVHELSERTCNYMNGFLVIRCICILPCILLSSRHKTRVSNLSSPEIYCFAWNRKSTLILLQLFWTGLETVCFAEFQCLKSHVNINDVTWSYTFLDNYWRWKQVTGLYEKYGYKTTANKICFRRKIWGQSF
jgi:hypothetical protein